MSKVWREVSTVLAMDALSSTMICEKVKYPGLQIRGGMGIIAIEGVSVVHLKCMTD